MKSKNKFYVLVTIAIVGIFSFFLTSKAWMPSEKETRNENYDTLFNFEGWEIRVNNAKYDEQAQSMTFTVLERTKNQNPVKPEISFYNGVKSEEKTPLQYNIQDISDTLGIPMEDEDYIGYTDVSAYTITVHGVPLDYWYVSVNFKITEITRPEVAESSEDIFTELSEPEATEKVYEKAVQIDYRLAQ